MACGCPDARSSGARHRREAIDAAESGDTIEIAAPADLAYGPMGKGPIPGGATLLFTVKLIDIE